MPAAFTRLLKWDCKVVKISVLVSVQCQWSRLCCERGDWSPCSTESAVTVRVNSFRLNQPIVRLSINGASGWGERPQEILSRVITSRKA